MMRQLARDMDELVATSRREIPRAFESDDYSHRVEEAMKEVQAQTKAVTEDLDQRALAAGFSLRTTPAGITPVAVKDGRPLTGEEYEALSKDVRSRLTERAEELQHSIGHATAELRRLSKAAVEQSKEVDQQTVRYTLSPMIEELQATYNEYPDVYSHLEQVATDMAEHYHTFKATDEAAQASAPGIPGVPTDEDVFGRYRVNDLVDNTSCVGAPVIFEHSPTYYNLFGRIEYKARVGTFTTDLTMIKCGSLHKASGGYLIVQARDLLSTPLSWETLKRTLRSGELRIENIGEQYSPLPSSTLRPAPIPFNARIIMVGTPDVLRTLQVVDEDFHRYFKVAAEFGSLMDRTPENLAKYAAFVAARCQRDGMLTFHKTAVARVIDYSSRLVEHQRKLTTRFMDVSKIVTEANYWARKAGADTVDGEHVKTAIDQLRYRSSLTKDRLRELIEGGTIHIATEGEAVGQVNGLAILSLGEYSFGKPGRITARASLGRGQVMNIEREARMSGKIHDKGFIILTGYLQGKYGQNRPLSLQASIGFEQSYSEIDGDSASSTELYALLSRLSGLPLAQGIAVTGSVNQNGDVQAIGGATQKIEGFYDVCRAKGLTGDQGVMIPRDNTHNQVLKDEVIEAARAGEFAIYAVATIDEGIEVLTGVPAGELQEDGTYPEGTVHYLVEQRLDEMARRARDFGKGRKSDDDAGDGKEDL